MARKKRGRDGPGAPNFAQLFHYMLDCEALRYASPPAVKVLLRLVKRFNGSNNGRIAMSVRQAAAECDLAFNTVRRALAELQEKGFIAIATPGGFSLKDRHATEWHLYIYPHKEGRVVVHPNKPFMSWRRNQNADAIATSDRRKM